MDYRYGKNVLTRRRARLEVEALEDRFCPAAPSIDLHTEVLNDGRVRVWGTVTDEEPNLLTVHLGGVVNANTYTLIGGMFTWEGHATGPGTVTADCTDAENLPAPQATSELTNYAPTISLMIDQSTATGRNLYLYGLVTDELPGGRTITLTGKVNATVVTNEDGSFMWYGEASGLGTINAVTSDVWGVASNTAQVVVMSSAPTISLTIDQSTMTGKNVYLHGYVTDDSPGGLTVTLTGKVNATVVTNEDGSFMWTGEATGLGTINAVTSDDWGLGSNTAQVAVVSNAPVISHFRAIEEDGPNRTWIFEGRVTDESFTGLTVRFGGLPSLNNQTMTVESNGWFYLIVTLNENEEGSVWCRTTDWWGLESNVAYDLVRQTHN